MKLTFTAICLILLPHLLPAQETQTPAISTIDTTNYPTLGRVIRIDPAIDDLIDKSAKIEMIGDGFVWAEGPVWINHKDGRLPVVL